MLAICLELAWQLLLLQDPQYFHLPCGHEFVSFKFRDASFALFCTLACCVVYPGKETDSDWDSQATVLDEEPEEGDTDDINKLNMLMNLFMNHE